MREIRGTRFIAAKPEQVWRAVESQEAVRKWLGAGAEFEPKLGGQFRMSIEAGSETFSFGGHVVTWESGRVMAMTWLGLEPNRHSGTLLTLQLQPEGQGTLVTLIHAGFQTAELHESYKAGWGDPQKTMDKIAALASA